MSSAPDYAQPLSGWRSWLVAEVEGRPRIVSVVQHVLWPPRQALAAECLQGARWRDLARWRGEWQRHPAPEEGCRCGIYAASRLEAALQYLEGDGRRAVRGCPLLHRVLGRVLLWGRVVECERGWRGERAYPQCLYLPQRQASLAELEMLAFALVDYRVSVEILDGAASDQAILERLRASREAA
jgi:hypothetical protein